MMIMMMTIIKSPQPAYDYAEQKRTCTHHPGSQHPTTKQICLENRLQGILLPDSTLHISPVGGIIFIFYMNDGQNHLLRHNYLDLV